MKKELIVPSDIFGLLIGAVVYYMGYELCPKWLSLWGTVICLALMIIGVTVNIITLTVIKKRYSKLEFSAEQTFLKNAISSVENDIHSAFKVLKKNYNLSKLYLYLIIVLSLGLSFFSGGILKNYPLSALAAIIPISALCGSVAALFPAEHGKINIAELNKSDFPLLFKLLKEVKKATHVHRKIHLYPIPKYNAGIHQSDKSLNIFLGSHAVGILNRDELKQVLIHETAHFYNKDTRLSLKFNNLISKYNCCNESFFCFMAACLTKIPRHYLNYNWQLYNTASSRSREFEADKIVAKRGDKQQFVNALAKLSAFDIFCSEPLTMPRFTSNTPPLHIETDLINSFKDKLINSEQKWRKMMDNELSATVASHPVFALRRKNLEVENYCFTNFDTDRDYIQEQKKFMLLCDKTVYNKLLPDYSTLYRNNYAAPVKNIEHYKENVKREKALSTQEMLSVALSYEKLCDFENSKMLLNSILEKEPDNAYALFNLGKIYLLFGNDDGIDMLYRAINLNGNFTYNALELIENYCLKMGLEEKLQKHREIYSELCQNHIDRLKETRKIKRNDKLVAWDLDKNITDEIIGFILDNGKGIIDRIYIAKKVIRDDFCTYIVGIKPFENALYERVTILMDKVFLNLDLRNGQFTLSNLFINPKEEKYLKKVRKGLVYNYKKQRKNKKQGV